MRKGDKIEDYLINACETIDASFFSSDTFHDKQNLGEIRRYLGRWLRESESISKRYIELEEKGTVDSNWVFKETK